MTIVEAARGITGGVDTHRDVHVAAALDPLGGLLGSESFSTDAAGYKALLGWLETFGDVIKIGVEGTGSYGSGLARYLRRVGVEVIEVDRPDRQKRWRAGKSDPLDAIEAARAALSGRATADPSRATVPSRPFGSSSSPSARPARPGSKPSSRCATSATAHLSSSVAA